MASSSVSQEDFDPEYELCYRRSKIRTARAASRNQGHLPSRAAPPATLIGDATFHSESVGDHNGVHERDGGVLENASHDGASPKPTARSKHKATRSNYIKAKQRDRRKLREKRRSAGVVLFPESTGDSTGDDDDDSLSNGAENKKYQETEDHAFVTSKPVLTTTGAPVSDETSPSQLLEDVKKENDRLLGLIEEKNKGISFTMKENESLKIENRRLKDENSSLLKVIREVSSK